MRHHTVTLRARDRCDRTSLPRSLTFTVHAGVLGALPF